MQRKVSKYSEHYTRKSINYNIFQRLSRIILCKINFDLVIYHIRYHDTLHITISVWDYFK